MSWRGFACAFVLAAGTAVSAFAAGPADSGLPLPRFVSLAADEVNLRTGPGFRYPVSWVYVRLALPVEVIGEFGDWRQVRDHDGAEGWVHRVMLSGERTVMVDDGEQGVHRAPNPAAPLVARAEAGVLGRLERCRGDWCEVDLAGHRGWLPRAHLWGVYESESID